jgi:hypothetical protein
MTLILSAIAVGVGFCIIDGYLSSLVVEEPTAGGRL